MSTDEFNRFVDEDLARITGSTFVHSIEFHHNLGSTNDRALHLCQSSDLKLPSLVLAERQTEGRGRGSNRWWAVDGALTFSLLLDTNPLVGQDVSPAVISLVAALGIAASLDTLLTSTAASHSCCVKWPNDVYVDGRKICGILPERPATGAGLLVIGIGLNVNNSLADAPDDIRTNAVALHEIVGHCLSLTDTLIAILQGLEQAFNRFATDDNDLNTWWQSRCLLTGMRINASVADRKVSGICQGITNDGALILDTTKGREHLISATIDSFTSP